MQEYVHLEELRITTRVLLFNLMNLGVELFRFLFLRTFLLRIHSNYIILLSYYHRITPSQLGATILFTQKQLDDFGNAFLLQLLIFFEPLKQLQVMRWNLVQKL